jgi:protein-tyrosine phosphatase
MKKAAAPRLQVSIDPSFYDSLLFSNYGSISRSDANYSFMDPTFAIGNANSSYDPFNIIVNLDFPYNGVPHYSLVTELTSDKKLIFRVGILDSLDEPMDEVIATLVPILMNLVKYHYNQPRILFHCRAGISRSASVALAYYGKQTKYDLTRAYSQLASRRPVIHPNPGFIEALEEFLI